MQNDANCCDITLYKVLFGVGWCGHAWVVWVIQGRVSYMGEVGYVVWGGVGHSEVGWVILGWGGVGHARVG